MKFRIISIFSILVLSISVFSCTDDLLYDPAEIGDGESAIIAEISFTPLVATLSRSVQGGESISRMESCSINITLIVRSIRCSPTPTTHPTLRDLRHPTVSTVPKKRLSKLQSRSKTYLTATTGCMLLPMFLHRNCRMLL